MHNAQVFPTGIHVQTDLPYLGCSPDGLVRDDGIIEVKCPFTSRNVKVSPQTVPYLYNDGDTFRLHESHEYFYQVQGTLMCSNRQWCDFIVWTFEDIEVIRIEKDDVFINTMKAQLKDFFNDYFKEALLEKHLYRNSHKFLPVQERI